MAKTATTPTSSKPASSPDPARCGPRRSRPAPRLPLVIRHETEDPLMTANPVSDLLDRVRKLLAKAEDEGCTPAEAEALTAKAAELMARYGIDRALLGALHPETDRPADRRFGFERPWADVKAHLLAAVATALRCQCVQTQTAEGTRLHIFGYASDLERAEILYTSLLVQMARALVREPVPAAGNSAKAWRRSWMLGYCSAVGARIRAAEEAAVAAAAPAADETAAAGQ